MQRIFHLIYKANYRSTKNYKLIDPDGEELVETNAIRKVERWAVGGKLNEGIHPDYAHKFYNHKRGETWNAEHKPKPYDGAFWFEALSKDERVAQYEASDFTSLQLQTLKNGFIRKYSSGKKASAIYGEIDTNAAKIIAAMGLGAAGGWNHLHLNVVGMCLGLKFGWLEEAQRITARLVAQKRYENYIAAREYDLLASIITTLGSGFSYEGRFKAEQLKITHPDCKGIVATVHGLEFDRYHRSIEYDQIETYIVQVNKMAAVVPFLRNEKPFEAFNTQVLVEIQEGHLFFADGSSTASEAPEEYQPEFTE